MPSWAGIRRHSRTYATLLSAKSPEDDRPASSRAGSHFKQLSPATLDGQSSSSSDYGEDPESAHRQAVRLQYGHQSARADREESPVAPEPVVGSRSSYSTPVDGKDGRRYAGNKVNFKAWGLKRSLSNLSHKEKKTSSAVQTEHKHALSLPPGRKHVHTKDQAKTKEAQTVLQLITGLDTIYLPFTNLALTKAESTQVSLPDVSSKDVRKLKASLANPKEAPQIVRELKKIPVDGEIDAKNDGVHAKFKTKAACLECTDVEALNIHTNNAKSYFTDNAGPNATTGEDPKGHTKQVSGADLFTGKYQALSSAAGDGLPTPGKILGQVATSTGTFSALAGVTGRLIEASGSHEGLIAPPSDRMSILVYWWGYELVLPPPSLIYLGNARSVAGTLFTFLQALAVTGGVPEIAPFVRYISFYIDMEWKAISAQNKGKGVVLAATWVVPVAVVPRPFDLA